MTAARKLYKRVRVPPHFIWSENHPEPTLNIMTKLKFNGSWNEVKGKLKQKYAQLTDDDLLFAEGKDDEVLGRLQQKLGETKENLRDTIARL
ncbi:MAG: csbD [Prosthecobacter sp.]|nr:csbD [Prosthecobacter sp.]